MALDLGRYCLELTLRPQIFLEDDAIYALTKRLNANPQYFAVSANIVNNPLISWIHYGLGVYEPFFPVRACPILYLSLVLMLCLSRHLFALRRILTIQLGNITARISSPTHVAYI